MTLEEFFEKLKKHKIKFVVNDYGEIRTKYKYRWKGKHLEACPICALSFREKKLKFINSHFPQAAKALGLSEKDTAIIGDAADNYFPFERNSIQKEVRKQLLELCK